MHNLLYFKASPRKDRSRSIAVADAFVDAYLDTHPDTLAATVDLFEIDLPAFDGPALSAKYKILHGKEHTDEERQAWKAIETHISRFKSADKYVWAVPMWNFGIPYRLKQYIDIIVQPGYTFSFTPDEGYKGLVTGKPILVCYARGGEYSTASGLESFDFQRRYLDAVLGFIGFTNIHSIIVEPTLLGGADVADAKLQEAIERAKALAATF